MNTNFKMIGLTRLGIKPKSTALDANALTTRPSELLTFQFKIGKLTSKTSNKTELLTSKLSNKNQELKTLGYYNIKILQLNKKLISCKAVSKCRGVT